MRSPHFVLILSLLLSTASTSAVAATAASACQLPFSKVGVSINVAERRGYLLALIREARGGSPTTFGQEQAVKDYVTFLESGAIDCATPAEISSWRSAFGKNGVPASVYEPELAALEKNSRVIEHETRKRAGEKLDGTYANGILRNIATSLMMRGKNTEATALFTEQAKLAAEHLKRLRQPNAHDMGALYQAQMRAGQIDDAVANFQKYVTQRLREDGEDSRAVRDSVKTSLFAESSRLGEFWKLRTCLFLKATSEGKYQGCPP